MSSTLSLVLDLIIAGLLVATIVYAIILNRQLTTLREGRGELEALIRNFNEATVRAESGIKGMKRAASETGEGLQKSIERGSSLRDELHFLIEAAEASAQRLASASGGSGRAGNSTAPPPPARRPLSEPRPPLPDLDDVSQDLPRGRGVLTRSGLDRAETRRAPGVHDEVMENVRDGGRVGRGMVSRSNLDRPEPTTARAEPDLDTDDLVRRVPGRNEGGERLPATTSRGEDQRPARREGGDGLSRAERELLQAMESRR